MAVGELRDGDGPLNDGDLRHELVALLPRLRRFCFGLAGNRDAGDDLAQSAIARALAAEDRFRAGTRLDSWLFKIAQNLQIDAWRREQGRGVEVGVDALDGRAGDDGRAVVESRSELENVRGHFARLPEEQRAVLSLIVVDSRSYRDAADILGIPIGTVMSRLCRARAALASAIGESAN